MYQNGLFIAGSAATWLNSKAADGLRVEMQNKKPLPKLPKEK